VEFAQFSINFFVTFRNPACKGALRTGLLVTQEKMQAMLEDNTKFAKFRYKVMSHLSGISGRAHVNAVQEYDAEKKQQIRNERVVRTLLRCAVTDIEVAAGGIHFETLVTLLASSGADIGSIGHGL